MIFVLSSSLLVSSNHVLNCFVLTDCLAGQQSFCKPSKNKIYNNNISLDGRQLLSLNVWKTWFALDDCNDNEYGSVQFKKGKLWCVGSGGNGVNTWPCCEYTEG